MPFKQQFFRITLLIIGLWSIACTAFAQDPDKYIFRYHLVYPSWQRGNMGIRYTFEDGTSMRDNWLQLRWNFDFTVDREVYTAKRIAYVDVFSQYDSNEDTDDCSKTFSATWYVSAGVWGNAYGSQVTDLIMPKTDGRGSRGCSYLPDENTTKVEMSIIPIIHIQNPDPERADPLKNIYCDNQPVHLKVDYHGGDAQNDTYWQYRLDPSDNFHPLSAIGEIDNWDNPGSYVHGPDVQFTLQQVLGANYTQYLNKRIEFRAVHAQKYEYGYWDGDNIQRHVDKPNEGSNTFTYIFYPSTVVPLNVKAIDPPCSDGNTFGIDIQFNRPLVPGEVISPITIKTQVGDQTVDQYPRAESDPPITLDASNTFHFSGTLNPGNYYLNIEGYYLDPLNRQCNENNYNFTIHAPAPVSFAVDNKKDVACLGEANGTITLKGDGGVGGYAYSIDNGANWSTSSNFTGLAKGSYIALVRDANNCPAAASQTVTIDQPTAALTAEVTGYSDPTSATKNDGSISIAVNGGTGPYTYLWSNGATTQNISELGGDTYTVTITDAHGCTAGIDPLALVSPQPITISFTETPVSCFGLPDGGLQAIVSGGVTPYTYSWSNGSRTNKVTNLAAGHYSLVVTDANNVKDTLDYDLKEPAVLGIVPTVTQVSCNSKTDGAITTIVNGGTTPYTYRWSNGAATQNLSQLPAGNYHLSVTDAHNCRAALDTVITAPAALSITGAITPPGSFGASDAKVDATVTGGAIPYAYAWSNSATTEDLDAVTAGDYSLNITDKNNCTATKTFAVKQPAQLVLSISRDAVVSCYGSATGTLTAHVSGGVLPYTYQWSNGGTAASLTQLPAGHYEVQVTDANNVKVTADYDLTAPAALEILPTVTPVSCNGKTDGSITTVVNGGTAPYSYRWSNGATTPDISQLPAGSYHLSVTDVYNCPVILDIPVTAPPPLSINGTVTMPSGPGKSDAKINVTVTGGTIPYTYAWSNGAATGNLNALAAGDYTLHVTDKNNCTATKTFTVYLPDPLVLNISKDAVIGCYGSSAGALTAHVSGGVLPYTYQWSNGGTTAALTQLPAGSYELMVIDANGTKTTAIATLTSPPVLQLTVTGSEISCNGGQTGTVTSVVDGGTPPYNYRWSTGATTPSLSGVDRGMYTLHVTDANNCTLSGSATVTGAGALAVTAFTQPPSCTGNNNGFIDLQPSGGHTPYAYSWSNGAVTKDIDNLPAGTYTVQLTDNNNCGITQSFTLPEPAPLQLDLGSDRTLCGGQSIELDGSIPGGMLYSWSGPDGFTANTAAVNISKTGHYTLVAVDGNSCQATDDVSITQDAREIIANFLVSTEAFTGDAIVAVNITAQAADHVEWQLPAAAKIISQSDNLVELRFDQPGNYGLTLNTQLGNCQTAASRNIMILASTQLPGVSTPHTSLFVRTVLRPNPNNGHFYLDIQATADANVNYRLLDVQRNRVVLEQKGQLTKDVLNTQEFSIPNLPAGVYVLLVESSLETKALKVLIL